MLLSINLTKSFMLEINFISPEWLDQIFQIRSFVVEHRLVDRRPLVEHLEEAVLLRLDHRSLVVELQIACIAQSFAYFYHTCNRKHFTAK